jgi:hypothetical protein
MGMSASARRARAAPYARQHGWRAIYARCRWRVFSRLQRGSASSHARLARRSPLRSAALQMRRSSRAQTDAAADGASNNATTLADMFMCLR